MPSPASSKNPIKRLGKKQIGVMLVTAIMAVLAFLHILSGLAEKANPLLAARVWSGNDVAWSQAASAQLLKMENLEAIMLPDGGGVSNRNNRSASRISLYARASLLASPMQEGALRNLAMASLIEGKREVAEELALAAYGNSRRDVGVQMVLVVRRLERGEIPQALNHIDEALRTNNDVAQQVFPALAQALTFPEFKAAFQPYVRKDNRWLADFLVFALSNRLEPALIGEIIAEAGELPDRPGRSVRELAPAYLVAEDQVRLAREIAAKLSEKQVPAANGGLSDNTFSNDDIIAPFGWDWSTSRQLSIDKAADKGGSLEIRSTLPFSGEIMRQMLTLPAGRYRLSYRGHLGDNSGWVLRCASTNRTLLSNETRPIATFSVPSSGCDGQWLFLTAKALGPLDIRLDRVDLSHLD